MSAVASNRSPKILIVSPALAAANNGNWHTARRWQSFLAPMSAPRIALAWKNERVDVLIALHARRSADSIERFAARYPNRPIVLVLTGTDVYRDIAIDATARRSLDLATFLVVLQEEALDELPADVRRRARVIVQSAARRRSRSLPSRPVQLIAIGHLREEKDPLTMVAAMRAVARKQPNIALQFTHIGNPLDERIAADVRGAALELASYRWLGGLPYAETRARLAGSHALVHASRIEGGANVVIEAVRSNVPVLASDIPGNRGLLGRNYAGYFPVGDAQALARLILRFAADARFAARLRAQCAARAELFAPKLERLAVRRLVRDALTEL